MPQGAPTVNSAEPDYSLPGPKVPEGTGEEAHPADAIPDEDAAGPRLLREDRGVFDTIRDWLSDAVHWLKGNREQKRMILAQRLFEKALRTSDPKMGMSAAQNLSVKRTQKMPYNEQIDGFFNPERNRLGRTDDVFLADKVNMFTRLGFAEKPVFMLKGNMKKTIRAQGNNPNYSAHAIPEETVRKLPKILRSPALIIVGENRISVIAGIEEKVATKKEKAAPLLIGIDPNSSVDGESAYEVKSVYGVDGFYRWLQERSKDSKIYAGDANKAAALLRDVRIQSSEPVAYATDLTPEIVAHFESDVNGENSPQDPAYYESMADAPAASPTRPG